jgi:hypothetical protein
MERMQSKITVDTYDFLWALSGFVRLADGILAAVGHCGACMAASQRPRPHRSSVRARYIKRLFFGTTPEMSIGFDDERTDTASDRTSPVLARTFGY